MVVDILAVRVAGTSLEMSIEVMTRQRGTFLDLSWRCFDLFSANSGKC
jgi:hypothetical protein